MPDDTGGSLSPLDADWHWPRALNLLTGLAGGHSEAQTERARGMTEADWREFADLVISRHRVAPAICAGLDRTGIMVPDGIATLIRGEARANGLAALAQKAESLRLAGQLAQAGIRAIWLKGWPLAEQLYGAAGGRHASDIDILVAPGDRVAVASLLTLAGYVAVEEHAVRARLIRWRAVCAECKDIQFRHPESGLVVELHWRSNHFRGWPDFGDLGEAPVPLAGIEGTEILVPGPAEQLVFLSGHGVQHLFGRLKWLFDIARLAAARGAESLEADLARAEAAGSGRVVRLSLHMAAQVFGAPVPERARRLGRSEARWAGEMLRTIGDPAFEPGRPMARLGFYRWHLRLAETPAQVAGVLRYAFWRKARLGLAGLTHRADRRVA